MTSDSSASKTRRSFLTTAVAATAAVGGIAALWPLVAQFKPGADVVAAGDRMEVDLTGLAAGALKVVRWKEFPIVVVHRTQAMRDALQRGEPAGRLIDPDSLGRQQPAYARNSHRSIDPKFAVLVGVCTGCACKPEFQADGLAPDPPGSFICPCCASHFDSAGRVSSGLARQNLAVPPHALVAPTRVMLGQNAPGDALFSLRSVETL